VLDAMRGALGRGAPHLRSLIGPAISRLPPRVLYGATYIDTRSAIQRASQDADFANYEQTRLLRSILKAAWESSTFYRSHLGQNLGTDHSGWIDSFAPADLSHLPVITRDVVRQSAAEMRTQPDRAVDAVTTSGSSGLPLEFYLPKSRSSWEWAFITELWSEAGWSHDAWRAVLRGTHFPRGVSIQADKVLKELRLSPYTLRADVVDEYLHEIAVRGIRFIHGYPSALAVIASRAMQTEWAYARRILGIFPVSESLTAHQRMLLAETFPASKVLPFYGLSEKVAFASESREVPGRYRFSPIYGITDVVDGEGRPVDVGCEGRIIATGLRSTAMPFIRYDTGDRGKLVRRGTFLEVEDIHSRWSQEFLYGERGEQISMTALNLHSAIFTSVHEFQFFQQVPGVADLLVVPAPTATSAELEALKTAFQSKLAGLVGLTLVIVDSIPRRANGKRAFIEQQWAPGGRRA
jgi:phenylacetate-CoA ligase